MKGVVTSVKVVIPEGVAVRINATGAMSSISIDRERFPDNGGYYQSVNYDAAEFKVELDLSVGVGSISVK
jgi:predicted membrane protein